MNIKHTDNQANKIKYLPYSTSKSCVMKDQHTLLYHGSCKLSDLSKSIENNTPIILNSTELVALTNNFNIEPTLTVNSHTDVRKDINIKVNIDCFKLEKSIQIDPRRLDVKDSDTNISRLWGTDLMLDEIYLNVSVLKYGKNRVSSSDVVVYLTNKQDKVFKTSSEV